MEDTTKLKYINSRFFFYSISAFALIVAFLLLNGYIPLIIMAGIIALIYHPMYRRLLRLFRGRHHVASATTIIFFFLTIIVPLTLTLAVVATQVVSLSNEIKAYTTENDTDINIDSGLELVNNALARIPVNYELEREDILNFAQNAISPLGDLALSNVISIGNTAAGAVAGTIIFITLISAIMINMDKLAQTFRKLSPLEDRIDRLYLSRLGAMSIAMVKGTFVIALVQGLVSGAFLWLAGVDYLALWILLCIVFSIIPLGAAIITVPIGIMLILTGNVAGGLLQILGYYIVVGNIDNFLRPQLVPKEASLHPALTLLAIFAGLKAFGFLGIIFGPMIMIFLVTTVEVYLKYYRVPTKLSALEDVGEVK